MNNNALVIVNYNDYINTIKLIENVKDYKSIKKVVVVDNCSTDESVKYLKEYESNKVVIMNLTKNLGYAGALNKASRYLNKEYEDINIIFSNSDIVIPNEDVIKTLNKDISKDNVCVMPKVIENDEMKYGWKLTSPSIDLLINIPYFNRSYRDKYIYYKSYDEDIKKVDVIYGCFFMIKGSILKKIDYFDDHTFLYFEEYILGRKLESINKNSLCDKTVYVNHMHNKTIGSNVSNLNKYKIYKKSQMYYEKNYNNANAFIMVLFYLFYYINLIPLQIKRLLKK